MSPSCPSRYCASCSRAVASLARALRGRHKCESVPNQQHAQPVGVSCAATGTPSTIQRVKA
jgi:hypothetical protein